jgi:hypothetical protein
MVRTSTMRVTLCRARRLTNELKGWLEWPIVKIEGPGVPAGENVKSKRDTWLGCFSTDIVEKM